MKRFLMVAIVLLSGCSASFKLADKEPAKNVATIEEVNASLKQIQTILEAYKKKIEELEAKAKK